MRGVVVIGVGNQSRGDDAAGIYALQRLGERELPPDVTLATHEGEAIGLHELWDGADAVVLVDSVASGAPPGTVHRIDASHRVLPGVMHRGSSHAVGVADAIELARVLGTLPGKVIVFGVEGAQYELGAALTDEVASAVDELIAAIYAEATGLASS